MYVQNRLLMLAQKHEVIKANDIETHSEFFRRAESEDSSCVRYFKSYDKFYQSDWCAFWSFFAWDKCIKNDSRAVIDLNAKMVRGVSMPYPLKVEGIFKIHFVDTKIGSCLNNETVVSRFAVSAFYHGVAADRTFDISVIGSVKGDLERDEVIVYNTLDFLNGTIVKECTDWEIKNYTENPNNFYGLVEYHESLRHKASSHLSYVMMSKDCDD